MRDIFFCSRPSTSAKSLCQIDLLFSSKRGFSTLDFFSTTPTDRTRFQLYLSFYIEHLLRVRWSASVSTDTHTLFACIIVVLVVPTCQCYSHLLTSSKFSFTYFDSSNFALFGCMDILLWLWPATQMGIIIIQYILEH